MINLRFAILLFSLVVTLQAHADNVIEIWGANQHNLSQWEVKRFSGETEYSSITDDGEYAIKAVSHNNASGLYKSIHINLDQTPYLHWRWKIKNTLNNSNEKEKQGDDFAARVYVIADTGFFFWNKKVICYVWANQAAKNASWDNPFSGDRVKQLVVRNGDDQTNTWYSEVRNVQRDFKQLFDLEVNTINDIAIMTDTDNTHLSATAWYADIFFSDDKK